jgi:hypothetical protein
MTSIHPDIERVAVLNWHIYPASRYSKAGCFKGASDAATCDLEVIARWTREYPGCGWRVVCGPSGLFGMDVDRPGTHKADGVAALKTLVDKHGPLPHRPMTRTGGSGGAVLFFKHQGEALRGNGGCPLPGLDPHRGQQAIVLPPSIHPVTKGSYTWRVAPWEVAPPPIPEWLAKLLKPKPEPKWKDKPWVPTNDRAINAVMTAVHAVRDAPSGAANDTLNKQAFKLGSWCASGFLSESEAADCLYNAARMRSIPDREAQATIKSGLRAGLAHPVEARHAG